MPAAPGRFKTDAAQMKVFGNRLRLGTARHQGHDAFAVQRFFGWAIGGGGRQMTGADRGPRDVRQRGQDVVDGGPASAPDVEHVAVNVGGGASDSCFDGVSDKREVASLLAIAVDLDLVALNERSHES